MADATNRKQQLAAARKKLKAYKKTGGGLSPHDNGLDSNQRSQSPQAVQNAHNSAYEEHMVNNRSEVNHVDPQQQQQQQYNSANSDASNSLSNNQAASNRPYTESTESLHQLSRKVSDLIAESGALINGSDSMDAHGRIGIEELEARNRELASSLSQQSQVNAHLNAQLNDLKQQCSRLQESLGNERKSHDERLKREMSSLKEQLQVHIQTIGILVAEKTELQSSLNQSLKSNESKHSEIEELNGRLKASRQRVADLERNFSTASSANQKNEKSSKDLSKEVDKLKMDLYKLNKSNEEFQQHNLELQGKLQKKISEAATLEDDIIDLKGKLEMSEVYIQQLKSGGAVEGRAEMDAGTTQKIEQLLSEKSELTSRLQQQESLVEEIRRESDTTKQQYSQYIEQIQTQAQQLQHQVSSLVKERDDQATRCQELESIILDWKARHGAATEATVLGAEEKAELLEQIERLRGHVEAMSKNLEVQVADNAQLGRLIIEKEQRMVELELTLERMGDMEIDKDRLLEAMNNDKSALSRAIAQNKELKSQLTELQNGFVKMSKDNMELMTQLQNEQHIGKELASRVSQQEEELRETNHMVQMKEHELSELLRRDGERETDKESGYERTAEQKLRDFQQMSPLIDNLQRELASAQDTINTLTNQNSELRNHQHMSNTNNYTEDMDQSRVESLNAAVVQLELERNHVLEELKESQRVQNALQDKLHSIQHDLATQAPASLNGDVITKVHFEALQHAMKQLEEKYTRVMRDKADLVDKTERLEHIVLQLQGETDTIGEYVSLYQQQRHILRQRTAEKDGYIYRLAQERLDMQSKLGQLQALVMQLLGERNMLHSYRPASTTPSNGLSVPSHLEHEPGTSPGSTPPPHKRKRRRRKGGETLDENGVPEHDYEVSTDTAEDWPDYSGSSSESENEAIIHTHNHAEIHTHTHAHTDRERDEHTHTDSLLHSIHHSVYPPLSNTTGGGEVTAQRIMTLLNEIGTSNVIERSMYDDRRYIHCERCTGPLHVL